MCAGCEYSEFRGCEIAVSALRGGFPGGGDPTPPSSPGPQVGDPHLPTESNLDFTKPECYPECRSGNCSCLKYV